MDKIPGLRLLSRPDVSSAPVRIASPAVSLAAGLLSGPAPRFLKPHKSAVRGAGNPATPVLRCRARSLQLTPLTGALTADDCKVDPRRRQPLRRYSSRHSGQTIQISCSRASILLYLSIERHAGEHSTKTTTTRWGTNPRICSLRSDRHVHHPGRLEHLRSVTGAYYLCVCSGLSLRPPGDYPAAGRYTEQPADRFPSA